jgi:glycine cleavage system H protein
MSNWKTPSDCKYTDTDEWVRLEGGEAAVGLTDYAQDKLSDIVYVEFPEVGESFDKGDEFGEVESVKASAPIKMPIGGKVVTINKGLEDAWEAVNQDPYGGGWIIQIKPSDTSELDDLMDAAAYAKYCDERG